MSLDDTASSVTYFDVVTLNDEPSKDDDGWLASDEIFPRPSFAIRPDVQLTTKGWGDDPPKYIFKGSEAIFAESLRLLMRDICGPQSLQDVVTSALGKDHHPKLAWHFVQSLFAFIYDHLCRKRCHAWRLDDELEEVLARKFNVAAKRRLRLHGYAKQLQKHMHEPAVAKETLSLFLEQMVCVDYGLVYTTIEDRSAEEGRDVQALVDIGKYLSKMSELMFCQASLGTAELRNFAWIVKYVAEASWQLGLQTPDVIVSIFGVGRDHPFHETERTRERYRGAVFDSARDAWPSQEYACFRRKVSVDVCDIIPAVMGRERDQMQAVERAITLLKVYTANGTVCLAEGPYATRRRSSYAAWVARFGELEHLFRSVEIAAPFKATKRQLQETSREVDTADAGAMAEAEVAKAAEKHSDGSRPNMGTAILRDDIPVESPTADKNGHGAKTESKALRRSEKGRCCIM
jgi:hypothetical protein